MPTGISILTSKGDPPAKKSVVAKTTFPKLQIAKLTSGPKRRCLRQLGGTKRNDCSCVHASAPTFGSKFLAAVLDCWNGFFPVSMQLMRLVTWGIR